MVNWTNSDLADYVSRRKRSKQDKVSDAPEHPMSIQVQPTTDEAKLNKTEKAYLAILRSRRYEFVGVQCITLKLGDDCRYTPDFIVLNAGIITADEVKGFWRDDAKVKIKVAARMYPWIAFRVIQKNKAEWTVTLIKP
jgi:hypothetical protein